MMKKIILASGSPRRQQFFSELRLDYEIIIKSVDEIYPQHLEREQITNFLAQLKATPFKNTLNDNEIVITSDTIVYLDNQALGKPKDYEEGFAMLRSLSGRQHEVITSVCFTTTTTQKTVHSITKVTFKTLTEQEIDFYLTNYKPYDKAGAYGIQEWIGYIGVENIEGSYNNVIGLPTHLVYKTLQELV